MSSNQTSSKPNQKQTVDELIKTTNKEHGENAIVRLGDESVRNQAGAIKTGSLALDTALGIGGYPKGRIVEIFGPESSGKTTLTLHAIAAAQRGGSIAAFIDAEHAIDVRYAQALGVDLDTLVVSQPDCGEQGLDIAEHLLSTGSVGLVVVDSVAALVPKAEIDGDMGDSHMGLHARLMSQALRKLGGLVSRTNSTLVFINQLRQKIGVVFGNPETTTGGQALRFYASMRLDVRRIGKVTIGDKVIGNRTRVRVVKNKCAPPFTEAEFDIRWGAGIDAPMELVDLATELGVIEKSGSHLRYAGKGLAQGRERAREALLADEKLLLAVQSEVSKRLSGPVLKSAACAKEQANGHSGL
jgi:recombination protein RecA